MKLSEDRSYQWMFYLTVAFLLGAITLRSGIEQQNSPELWGVLGLLTIWISLFIGEAIVATRWPHFFSYYLVIQSMLAMVLLFTTEAGDYFAVLFLILSMQVVMRLGIRPGITWIVLFIILMAIPMIKVYGPFEGLVFVLIYAGGSGLLASYTLALRRTQDAHSHNQVLMHKLEDSNRQLQLYGQSSQRLVAIRERQHLARELHDAVTQTIFTMTLTTKSALLLLDREPARVSGQLDRLRQLAQSALTEMQLLISELRPEKLTEGGLVVAIRRHLARLYLPESLPVSFKVEGEQLLNSSEEQELFRIVQEALNNIVKHAQSPKVDIQLSLTNPPWIEITDQGRGFDLKGASNSNGIGLTSMRERANGIGWDLWITTSPGAGTRIHVEKRR